MDKSITDCTEELLTFLDKYMLKEKKSKSTSATHTYEDIKSTIYRDSDITDDVCNYIIEIIKKSKQAEKFNKLYFEGDITDYDEDDSSADLALCDILAFYCGEDIELIDTLFCKSKLYRTKWDRPDYKSSTITKAIESCGGKFYKKTIKKVSTIKSITAKELISMELEAPHTVVENMICQGVTIFAGAPKIGKSWSCLDLCISSCKGQPFLGFNTNKCDCSYFALEDSWHRLQNRLKKVLGDEDIPENFHLQINCSPLDNGLIEELENHLKEFPKVKLIIIDTFQKIRGSQSGKSDMYRNDYNEVSKIKSFADEHKICIVLIHHLKKGKEDDVFEKINGSNGIGGAADTSIVLSKIKDKKEVLFSIQGRDVESNEKFLLFNKETFKWEVVCSDLEARKDMTDIESYERNPIVMTIKKLLEENTTGVKITASNLLTKIFEITGTYPKEDKPNTLSREITSNLQYKLLKYDGIHYEHKARILFFSKPKVEE